MKLPSPLGPKGILTILPETSIDQVVFVEEKGTVGILAFYSLFGIQHLKIMIYSPASLKNSNPLPTNMLST